MNVHFVIAPSLKNKVASEALWNNQGLLKSVKGLGKDEFFVVYERLTTKLTSGGCVEESSIGWGQYGKNAIGEEV